MARINHIVFIAGGVLMPTVTQAALAALDLDRQPDARAQLALHDLERALATGSITPELYCLRVIEQTGAVASAADLMAGVVQNTGLLPGMLALVEGLAARVDLGLVSDYPAQWVRPIIENSGLSAAFPDGPNQITADLHSGGDYRRLFARLIALQVLRPGHSMWVDYNSLRCMAAIRAGVDAGIFVDARRFYRDLWLWGLVPFTEIA